MNEPFERTAIDVVRTYCDCIASPAATGRRRRRRRRRPSSAAYDHIARAESLTLRRRSRQCASHANWRPEPGCCCAESFIWRCPSDRIEHRIGRRHNYRQEMDPPYAAAIAATGWNGPNQWPPDNTGICAQRYISCNRVPASWSQLNWLDLLSAQCLVVKQYASLFTINASVNKKINKRRKANTYKHMHKNITSERKVSEFL